MICRSAVFSVLPGLLAAACSSTSAPTSDLRVSTAVSSTIVHPGTPLVVRISVANRGTAARTIDASGCNQFVVVAANGDVVAPRQGCTLVPITRTLGPDESFTIEQEWAGDAGTTGQVLSPGDYWIRGQFRAEDRLIVGDSVAVRIAP